MTNDERIKANMEARQAAEVMMEMIIDEGARLRKQRDLTTTKRYLERMRHLLFEIAPEAPHEDVSTLPMSDSDCEQFGKRTLNFGKHSGQELRDIPRSYLGWLYENDNDKRGFFRGMGRYLQNRRIQIEYEKEIEDKGNGK